MGALPQALGISFEMQRKRSNEKITRRKYAFQLTKHVFFIFFSFLWISLIFKPHNFFIFLFILNDLKCYRSTTWSSTNHLGTLIAIESNIQGMSWVFGNRLLWCLVDCLFEFLTPLLWRARTFSFLIRFWQLLVCQMCQEEGFKFCLDTKNMKPSPWIALKCLVTGRSTLDL